MLTTINKTARTVEEYADACPPRDLRYLFANKGTRDAVAKELKDRGFTVKKGTSRGSTLHPEYVTDYVGTYETGFGNTDYNTYWKVLYRLEVEDRPEAVSRLDRRGYSGFDSFGE